MFRYLTPAKIGLLVLIRLYIAGAVPSDGIIPVLDFLTSHLLHPDGDRSDDDDNDDDGRCWAKVTKTASLLTGLDEFERVLLPLAAADGLPGRRLWDRFLERLWEIDSLHALHDFFEVNDERNKRLRPNSVFGQFVRRANAEYERLPFNHVAELWKAFVRYRQEGGGGRRRRHYVQGLGFDSVLVEGEQDWGMESTEILAGMVYRDVVLPRRVAVSGDDMEDLLEFQIGRMQSREITLPLGVERLLILGQNSA